MRIRQSGFSLIELMVVLVIFLIVSGAVFGLLHTAQIRYRAEQEFLESFQNARGAMEELVREIHSAGFPPPYTFPASSIIPPGYPYGGGWDFDPRTALPLPANPDLLRRFAVAFPGYSGGPVNAGGVLNPFCTMPGICSVPNATDLTMEMDLDPENAFCPSQVEIVDYQLRQDPGLPTSTLRRRVTTKPGGGCFLPINAPGVPFAPFVENLMPNPIDPLTGAPIPLFRYTCDPAFVVAGNCLPQYIREVTITVTVRSIRPDIETQQYRQITLQSVVRRMNPYQ